MSRTATPPPPVLHDAEVFDCAPPANAGAMPEYPATLRLRHPAASILTLTGVTISPAGYLYHRGRLLDESFARGSYRASLSRPHLWRAWAGAHLWPRARRAEAFWMTDNWSRNYFHWFTESVPRLVLARRAGIDVGRVLLPASHRGAGYITASLSHLGVDPDFTSAGVRVDRLVLPQHLWTTGCCASTALRDVHEALVKGFSRASPRAERVYLRRRPPLVRRVLNEDLVIAELEKHDFQVLSLEDLTWAEQVRLFLGCRTIVAPHGAALTNMLFMPAGGAVLEFLPRSRSGWRNACYFHLASSLGHRYLSQPPRDQIAASAADDGCDSHLTVDVDLLRRHLPALLS